MDKIFFFFEYEADEDFGSNLKGGDTRRVCSLLVENITFFAEIYIWETKKENYCVSTNLNKCTFIFVVVEKVEP